MPFYTTRGLASGSTSYQEDRKGNEISCQLFYSPSAAPCLGTDHSKGNAYACKKWRAEGHCQRNGSTTIKTGRRKTGQVEKTNVQVLAE